MIHPAAFERSVFTFWEPVGTMSPYLRLCLRTWERNLSGYRIVVLDRKGAIDLLHRDTYQPATLEMLSPPLQKDALMVAVLERHGGVFMDVDTLVFRDLAPLLEPLARSEAVMLGMHMAFLAARPGAELLSVWREGIQDKLRQVAENGTPPGGLPWDHLGNSELQTALDTLAARSPDPEPLAARALGAAARAVGGLPRRRRSEGAPRGLGRVDNALKRRRLGRVVAGPLRHHLALVDPRRSGFIAEAAHFRSRRQSARRKYERFWFEDDLDVRVVTALDPAIVGLHNSWTPRWFADLEESEVLEGRGLLSRTLQHLLSD